jgi:hypothetical protein
MLGLELFTTTPAKTKKGWRIEIDVVTQKREDGQLANAPGESLQQVSKNNRWRK